MFLVRKSNKPNEKRHVCILISFNKCYNYKLIIHVFNNFQVLVVHSTQFSQPKSCKYHINEKMENDVNNPFFLNFFNEKKR